MEKESKVSMQEEAMKALAVAVAMAMAIEREG